MPEPSDQAAQRQRHANWIGLRTLRQRPKLVGALPDGEPVYEVRSVRLVLRGQAPNFSRLVACERCGRGQAGAPVLTLADLDAPLRPVICADCVRNAGVFSVWELETVKPAAELAARPPAEVPPPADPVPGPPAGGSALPAPMEPRLDALAIQVDALSRQAEAHHAGQEERRREADGALSALTGAMSRALGEVRSEIAATSAQHGARAAAIETDVGQALAALRGLVEAQRADVAAIGSEIVRTRAEVQRVVAGAQDLAQAQVRFGEGIAALAQVEAALEERLQGMAAEVARAAAASTARIKDLEERLDRLAAHPVLQRDVPWSAGAGSDGARNGTELLDELETQLRRASDRLAARSADRPARSMTGSGEPAPAGGQSPETFMPGVV